MEITINGLVYVPKGTETAARVSPDGLKMVMIRSGQSGVHFGWLKSHENGTVELIDSRRVWYWAGAASLSQLAMEGSSKLDECKIAMELPEITVLGVCEIIPMWNAAFVNLGKAKPWKL